MKKLTYKDFNNLKHGDEVFRFRGIDYRKLSFVGTMPKNKNYLIFCEGEYLTFLYINTDGTFKDNWFFTDTSLFEIGKELIKNCNLKIKSLKSDIKNIKDIYK